MVLLKTTCRYLAGETKKRHTGAKDVPLILNRTAKSVYHSLRARRAGDRIPVGGEIFRSRPDRAWGSPSLLYNGYRVSFPRVKRRGRGAD